jgi:hypothetical protein
MKFIRRIVDQLVGRSNKVNVLTPIDESKGLHVVNQDVALQSRNSPDVPMPLAQDIVTICHATPEIERCHVLDVREPDSANPEMKNFIVVALDDSSTQLEGVALKLQNMLKKHPQYASNCFIATSDAFEDIFEKPQYALYIRGNGESPTR